MIETEYFRRLKDYIDYCGIKEGVNWGVTSMCIRFSGQSAYMEFRISGGLIAKLIIERTGLSQYMYCG